MVVEIGLPVWRPQSARGYVSSLGGGRASLEAVEELLVPRSVTTHLERELREQPAALERLLATQRASAERIAALLRRDDVGYVLIASRGSSSNAARYAQYVLGRAHRVPVAFATPSLYTLYGQPPRLDGALVLGISQSGRSPDVKEVLEEARRQGRPTVAITNDVASPLAAAADEVLALEAGEELAVAATKTYLNSLGAIALLFAVSTSDENALHELEQIPAHVALQLERSWDDAQRLDRLGELQGGTAVARGVNYATAYEIALEDPRAVGAALRGVFGCRPHARADRGDRCRAGPWSRSRRAGRRSSRWRQRWTRSRNAAHAWSWSPTTIGRWRGRMRHCRSGRAFPSGSRRSLRSCPASWRRSASRSSAASTSTHRSGLHKVTLTR